ncbi:HAD family hydrolase [Yoonia sp. 2307UL14-13]|uniref:HAD family hydrolase n=1 Tax=Yoonia sp. 2307UL14-13 TaxID=3126506 RepID=UPI0030B4F1E8
MDNIELVIFDCDGVLVDTEPVTDVVIAENLTTHGLPIAPDEVHRLFAGGTMAGVRDEAIERGAKLPENWLDQIYNQIFTALRKGVPTYDGLFDLLDALDAKGVKRAIASNGPMKKMAISLTPSGLWDRFAGRIYSGHDHGPKPAPDMLLKIMADAGVGPNETIMIDDMPAGFQAAKATGIRCLAFLADGDQSRANGSGATPVRSMPEVHKALGLPEGNTQSRA